jgi:outer membrane lipoprotein SlyB
MDLVSVQIDGRMVDINTSEVSRRGDSQTKRTAGMAGGGAALGAIIGAIAGGGKGAAIGAVTGAGAGGAVAVVTKGQKIRIPSETRLEFTTQYPVRL